MLFKSGSSLQALVAVPRNSVIWSGWLNIWLSFWVSVVTALFESGCCCCCCCILCWIAASLLVSSMEAVLLGLKGSSALLIRPAKRLATSGLLPHSTKSLSTWFWNVWRSSSDESVHPGDEVKAEICEYCDGGSVYGELLWNEIWGESWGCSEGILDAKYCPALEVWGASRLGVVLFRFGVLNIEECAAGENGAFEVFASPFSRSCWVNPWYLWFLLGKRWQIC